MDEAKVYMLDQEEYIGFMRRKRNLSREAAVARWDEDVANPEVRTDGEGAAQRVEVGPTSAPVWSGADRSFIGEVVIAWAAAAQESRRDVFNEAWAEAVRGRDAARRSATRPAVRRFQNVFSSHPVPGAAGGYWNWAGSWFPHGDAVAAWAEPRLPGPASWNSR